MKHRTGHLFKRGETFYVRWAVNGKIFSKALRDDNGHPITNRRDAEEAQVKSMATFVVADEATALESIAAKLEGRKGELTRLQDEQNPPLGVAKAWVEYLNAPNRPDSGDSTLHQYEFQFGAFEKWLRQKLGEAATLRDVTQEIAEEYAAQLNHGRLSASTYNKHLNLLTLVFRVVKKKAHLTSNPWEEIQRKRLTANSRRELTIEELRKICQKATGELQTLLGLGVYSGLRLGDCATLRWGEVDLTRGIIRRIPNKTARRNPKPVIVPIHPTLRDMLAATAVDQRGEYVLPETATRYQHRTDEVTDRVQNHFKACGLALYKPGTGTKGEPETGKEAKRAVIEVGFHSLRHTFVSLCRESNAPLSVVESIVGHSNPAMTRHYTHVGELAAGKAVAALPAIIGESTPAAEKPDGDAILQAAREIASKITAKNWREKKAALVELLTQ